MQGFITWNGGECPVSPETKVKVILRKDDEPSQPVSALLLEWEHNTRDLVKGSEIIAYKIFHEESETVKADGEIKVEDRISIAESEKFVNIGEYIDKEVKAKRTAADILLEGAETHRERGKIYGGNYHSFGNVMLALFPNGIALKTPEDHNRFHLFIQVTTKLTRYANSGLTHIDSTHDMMVYSAMLEELTKEDSQPIDTHKT